MTWTSEAFRAISGADRPGTDRLAKGMKVPEAVAQEVVRDIIAERLAAGDQLPSESQMIEKYNVSRASLREALQVLETFGLISRKPGRHGGPTVIEVESRNYARMSSLFFHMRRVTVRQLIDARLTIDPMMARRAAEQCGSPVIAALAEMLDDLPIEDDDAFVDAAHFLHRSVTATSGNPALDLISTSLEDMFRTRIGEARLPLDERRDWLDAWRRIVAAVLAGQADEAEELVRESMTAFAARLERTRPAVLDQVIEWR